MTKNHALLFGPLILALLGLAFCVWTALGNDVSFCVTTGCTLYQDFTIGKVSLWWVGTGAFSCLAALALLGQVRAGRFLAALFLLGDLCLLILMALTAPCISCLVVALLFALCYFSFRRPTLLKQSRGGEHIAPPLLLWIWGVFFIVNLGQVARSQFEVWPILDESGQPTIRMFFSPSCHYCMEGVNALSGNINVAFYPVADTDGDVARVQRMLFLLDEGQNMAEAFAMSRDAEFTSVWQQINPATIVLRFRLLCNKAHLFAQGSQGVPFFEFKGLPPSLTSKPASVPQPSRLVPSTGNAELPGELLDLGQCGSGVPCPSAESTPLQ